MFKALIPTVFYVDIDQGIDTFVNAVGMTLLHRDDSLAVAEKDGAKLHISQSADLGVRDRPEISIEIDDLDSVFADIWSRRPELLHPNLKTPTRREWGAIEFALLDSSGVCVVFRQWP